MTTFKARVKGGAHSGNFAHAGRPGEVGGSSSQNPAATHNAGDIVQARYDFLTDMPAYENGTIPEMDDGAYTGPEEGIQKIILHEQGFDGLPDVVSTKEMDQYKANGEMEVWRGLDCNGDRAKSAEAAEQFKTGELFVGKGTYGAGTYGGSFGDALSFAGGDRGSILRMTIKKGARVIEWKEAHRTIRNWANDLHVDINRPDMTDDGRWAASQGYDVMKIDATGYILILNRTAMRVDSHTYTKKELLDRAWNSPIGEE